MYREKSGLIIIEPSDLTSSKEGNLHLRHHKLLGDSVDFVRAVEAQTRIAYKKKK